ncbi:MAG TPA: cupin domain-containing protein [Humisphaera sp.]
MRAKITRTEECEALNVLGVPHIVHVAAAETNGTITFAEMQVPPGAGIPRHVHAREDEVFHVLAGQVAFEVNGTETVVGPGTTVFGPRNVPHAYRNAGTDTARILVTLTPGGLEGMFAELAKLPAGPPDLAVVSKIVGRYGVSFA